MTAKEHQRFINDLSSHLTSLISTLQDTHVCLDQLKVVLNGVFEQANFINSAIQTVSILAKIGRLINADTKKVEASLNMIIEEKISYLENSINVIRIMADIVTLVLENIEESNLNLNETEHLAVDIAQLLLSCFEFFAARQHSEFVQQNANVVHVFKNTTTAHSKFLVIIDRRFLVTDGIQVYNDVLDLIVKMGHVLLDLNLKLMAENWKSFITLLKKTLDSQSYNLSKAIKSIVLDINKNFKVISDREHVENRSTLYKATGFLVKLVLKLFELVELSMVEQFEDILLFSLTIYGIPHTASVRDKDEAEFYLAISGTTEFFLSQLLKNCQFLQMFFKLYQHRTSLLDSYFGFLNLSNELIVLLPNLLNNSISLLHENIVDFVRLVFEASSFCYKEFFEDIDGEFYENLVVNVSLIVLLFPSIFPQIEQVIFEYITCNQTWTALFVSDVWYLVLKNSTMDFCRTSFNSLLSKMLELNNGYVYCTTTPILRLKILLQRVWKLLLPTFAMDELSKYTPSNNIFVWIYLTMKHVPMSHRYYVEFILSDLYLNEKIMQRDNSTFEEVISVIESLDIVSNANLRELEINTSKLIKFLESFWLTLPQAENNKFWNYVIFKLIKVTTSFISEFSDESIYQIAKQIKISNELTSNLVVIELLVELSKRNFQLFKQKKDLRATVQELILNIFSSSSVVAIQIAIEAFNEIAQSNNGSAFGTEMMDFFVSQQYNRYFQRKFGLEYNITCLERDYKSVLAHDCKWSAMEPVFKKMKMDDSECTHAKPMKENVEYLINNLKQLSEQLIEKVIKSDLNERQLAEVQKVVNNLTCFV